MAENKQKMEMDMESFMAFYIQNEMEKAAKEQKAAEKAAEKKAAREAKASRNKKIKIIILIVLLFLFALPLFRGNASSGSEAGKLIPNSTERYQEKKQIKESQQESHEQLEEEVLGLLGAIRRANSE